jgi:hypothetical protein
MTGLKCMGGPLYVDGSCEYIYVEVVGCRQEGVLKFEGGGEGMAGGKTTP